jgi:ABC-type antimicrobial peptide transport system permease subunit
VLFGAFSGLALLLAAVGLYSVVSYSVVQRTNEFGIRMALGAQRRHVHKIVLASATVSVGLGIISGLVLSFGLNRTRVGRTNRVTKDMVVSPSVLLFLVFPHLSRI